MSRSRHPVVLALLAAAIAAPVAGCGGGSSGNENADPAKVAPASSIFYASAYVRPQGAQRQGVESILRKLGFSSGEAFARQAIKSSDRSVNYDKDVKSWLGKRVAVVVPSLVGRAAKVALIFTAKDAKKGYDKIRKTNSGKVVGHSYRGVDYKVDTGGSQRGTNSVARVGDYVVVGNEAGLKSVIDASKDGRSIQQSSKYKQAAREGAAKLGFGFLDLGGLVAAAGGLGGSGAVLSQSLGEAGRQPVIATLDAKPDRAVLEVSSGRGPQSTGASTQTTLVPTLPGDSWLAAGVARVGQTLRTALQQLGGGVGAVAVDAITRALQTRTGLSLGRDVLAPLGDIAFFARGSTVFAAGGGVVIQSPQPARAVATLRRLAQLIVSSSTSASRPRIVAPRVRSGPGAFTITAKGLPAGIDVASVGNKVVIAYNDNVVRAALKPHGVLGNSPLFQQAGSAVGGKQPSLFVSFAPIASLVSAAGNKPSAQKALRYLRALNYLAVGGSSSGSRARARVVVAFK